MHELNTSDIKRQEVSVREATHQRLAGFCDYFDDSINLLIRLYYRFPKIENVESPEGGYLSQLGYWFYMTTFSFRAAFLLMENGYYLEANTICRSLIETYVKMRYFAVHQDALKTFERPSVNSKKRPSITFKTMFDEVLPGYYDAHYRWMLSHMAHGGAGSMLFKADISGGPKNIKADQGVVFSEKWASFIMNNLTCFIFGYLRLYKHQFADDWDEMDKNILAEFQRLEVILEKAFNEHIKLKGGENEWHKTSRPIWDF